MIMHLIEMMFLVGGFILMMIYWCVKQTKRASSYITQTKPFEFLKDKGEYIQGRCDAQALDYMAKRTERATKKATVTDTSVV